MQTPFFSVIIPTYNRASFLPKAIESVLNQTFNDWELVIIDDGSTDNTKELVAAYNDVRIVYFYQENKERSAARNQGIELSRGKYICFLDSDDYYENIRLDELYKSIINKNEPIALFYTDIVFEKEGDRYTKSYKTACEDIYERIINEIIGTPQVCIHKTILLKHKFNENYKLAEDLDLWTRIALDYKFIYLKSPTIVAVEHPFRSINSNENHFLTSLQVIQNLLKNKDIKAKIKKKVISKSLSNIFFKIGIFYLNSHNKIKALNNLIKSVYFMPLNSRTVIVMKILPKILFN